METWKDIPTFEGRYQISTFGRVRNKKTSYILKSNSKGTPCVPFVINARRKNPESLASGMRASLMRLMRPFSGSQCNVSTFLNSLHRLKL